MARPLPPFLRHRKADRPVFQVRDVKFFPDGRSVVDTIGVARFKVQSHGQRDGYNTAKIEYLEDRKVRQARTLAKSLGHGRVLRIKRPNPCPPSPPQVEAEELVELLKLHDSVYEQANSWFTSLKDNMKSQILSHFGHLPSKDPDPQVRHATTPAEFTLIMMTTVVAMIPESAMRY